LAKIALLLARRRAPGNSMDGRLGPRVMGISDCFAANYAEARGKFRAAARGAGAMLESYANPAEGPDGVDLSTETAWLGPRQAERLLIVMSGTHGVEGFLGSGLQVALLRSGIAEELARKLGLLMIHALNPSGFAWIRRVTEGNVDLNRNFVDHDRPYPGNAGYEALRQAICPREWNATARAAADAILNAYSATHGAMALQSAISTGQFVDPEGLFYGGRAPTWSNRTLRQILKREAKAARHVALVDFHSGLGPYGKGEIIDNHLSPHPGFQRVKDWFGAEATSTEDGSSSSANVIGDVTIALDETLPRAAVSGLTLEFGTEPVHEMLDALRADNWLHVHGRLASAQGRKIKARLRQAFYPDRSDWRDMAWERAVDVVRRTRRALAQS
jgi:Protein of unknown function (DUF2817)